MNISLEVSNRKDCPLGLQEMRKIVLVASKGSRLSLGNKKLSLSVAFVSPAVIRKFNRIYRKKDKTTDILSFGEYRSPKEAAKAKTNVLFLGELIICCSFVKKSAKINGISYRRELVSVFSHGVLHLLGFDHSQKMFAIQDEVVENLK